ncbi:hypothetical protein [Peribacillus butanolivorans]
MLMLEAKLIEKSELHKLSLLDPLDGLRNFKIHFFCPKPFRSLLVFNIDGICMKIDKISRANIL